MSRPAYVVNGHRIVRCAVCGHLYVSPRPAMADVVEIYGSDYFANPAFETGDPDAYFGYKDYLGDRENIQRRLRQVLTHAERYAEFGPRRRVLDIGCGMGLFVDVAKTHGWDAWGVELNEHAVRWANENISDQVVHGTAADLDMPDGAFDCITMFDVIEHLGDPREELGVVWRLLRPGGVLVVVTPDAGALVSRAMGSHWMEMKRAPEHLHFFNVDGLARLLTLTGFTADEWHSIGKISTVRTLVGDLSFYSRRVFGAIERGFDRLGVGDVVLDVDPRTKMCVYARKTHAPTPVSELGSAAAPDVERVRGEGIGRVGVHRIKRGAADEFYDMQLKYWEGKERFLDPRDAGPTAFAEPKLAWAEQYVPIDKSTSVLDVGAGNGTVTWHLARRAGRVVGVDFSTNLLRRSPCPERMVQGDASQLPFRDREFDVVFESNFLHHVSDPLLLLREMKRVSRRYVVLIEPNRWHVPMSAFMALVKSERRGLRFDRKAVERMVNAAGLTLVAAEPQGAIYPNMTPRRLLRPLARFDAPSRLGAYVVAVAERPA